MEQKSNRLYAQMPPVRLFFHAAIPGVISMVSMSIYNIIEGIFIGQFAGGDAFAAMNLAMPLVMITFALADMVGVGSSVPISIALGRKDEDRASNLFSGAVLLILLIAGFTGAVMFLLAPQIMDLMGAEDYVAEQAVLYLRIFAVTNPLTALVFAMDNFLRISGFVRGSMLLNVLMSVLQTVFLVVLVVIIPLGLAGSAIAISLGMSICAFIALVPFVQGKSVLKFCRPRFSVQMLKQIVACGSPTFLNNMAGRLFSLVMNALLIRLGGTNAVAAFAVLMYSSDLVHPVLYGLCDSLQPAIGYNWGAEAYDRVKTLVKCVFSATAAMSVFAIGIMFCFPRQIASIFVTASETELLDLSAHALKLYSVKFFFWWFGFTATSFYNAIQKPGNAAVLTLATAIVFPLLMVVLLWPMGLDGLWLNQAATYIPVGIIAFAMLRKTQKEMKCCLK